MDDAASGEPASRVAADRIRAAIASGEVSSLDEAIAELRSLGDTTNLSAVLLARFDLTGDPVSLREAAAALQAAVDRRPGRPSLLSNYGLALIRLFELTDDLPTLATAISMLRQAVDLQAGTGRPKASYLANLGLGLVRLAERTGEASELSEAVDCHTVAAALAADQPATQAAMLVNLGAAQALWHRLDGLPTRLAAAVDAYREAVRVVPPSHRNARACLAGLGNTLARTAADGGDVALSLTAIDALRSAIQQLPDGDPDAPLFLNQLAEALRRSWALTGDVQALTESVDCRRTALDRTPDGHPDRLHFEGNLAISLRNRFEALGDVDDLTAADALVRAVLERAPADHPGRPKWLGDLAHIRHRLGGFELNREYMEEAAELLHAALQAVPDSGPDAVMHRINLGGVLASALELRWDPAEYDEAVRVLREGLVAAAPGSRERAELLLNLGLAYAAASRTDGTTKSYEAAMLAFAEVVATTTAPARIRAMASQHRASLSARRGSSAAALEAYRTTLDLLDLVAWRGLDREDQERALIEFRGVGSAAAASAMDMNDLDTALALLEQGRGVLLGQVLDRRVDHEALEVAQPVLARELQHVHEALESGARHRAAGLAVTRSGEEPTTVDSDNGGESLDRQRLAVRRDELLSQIRECDGFEDFLRAPDVVAMRATIGPGAVIMLNLAASRCDALITTGSETRVVPLADLSIEDAADRTASFLAAVDANTWGTNDVVRETLEWLWDVAVHPVLDSLAGSAAGASTRVWWVPTGALSLLPVHAAGHHGPRDGEARSALHRVVSSYTPTLRMLTGSGAGYPSAAGAANRGGGEEVPDATLIIAADSGHSPLAAAPAEARIVSTHRSGPVRALIGPECTRSAVLAELPGTTWVHVAGHAVTDPRRPSNSHLVLYEGRLGVREISALAHVPREMAYLSACSTAAGGSRLPDEVIHIASAFQLAGFRDTIGTLWRVPDRAARDMAAAVYEHLRHDPPASAVTLAARRHRDRYPANPYEWASFIHSGPG